MLIIIYDFFIGSVPLLVRHSWSDALRVRKRCQGLSGRRNTPQVPGKLARYPHPCQPHCNIPGPAPYKEVQDKGLLGLKKHPFRCHGALLNAFGIESAFYLIYTGEFARFFVDTSGWTLGLIWKHIQNGLKKVIKKRRKGGTPPRFLAEM